MSEQDTLRLVAEVVDRFSTPMRNLRSQLQGMSREGAAHAETLGKGFQKLEGSLKGVAQTTTTVLNPALATVGVTSLTVGAAIAGVGASLRSFAGNTAVLAQASRDTGVAAQTLRDVQNILGKVGVGAEQSGAAIVGFAEKMRLARDGIGPVMEFLRTQGRTAEGRKYFNDLADSLQHSKDNGDALVKALKGMEGIKDPVGRRLYAEQVLGLADAARLAEKHRGTIEEQLGKAAKALGPLDPKSLEASERFEKSMQSLQTTLQKLGTTVGTEVLPYAERLATWFDELAQGKRQDITKPLQDGLREVGRALREIDWESAGKTAREMLGLIGESAKSTGKMVQGIVLALQAVNDVKNGNVGDALKKLGELDKATDLGMGKNLPAGSIADGMRADTGPLMQRQDQIRRQMQVLDEVIARKESQPDPLGGDARQQATEEREKRQKLIDETAKLQGEIKRLRDAMPDKKPGEDATVQKSSFGDEASGGPLSGLIHKAGYGSGAGGEARGLTAFGDPYVQRRFQGFLQNRGYNMGPAEVGRMLRERRGRILRPNTSGNSPSQLEGRNFGGGRFNGLGGPALAPNGPGRRVRRGLGLEAEVTGEGRDGLLGLITEAEGTTKRGYNDSFAHQYQGTLTDKSLGEVEQIQRGMRGSSAIGRYQFMRNTLFGSRGRPGLVDELGIDRDAKFTPELQDRLANALIERRYQNAKRLQERHGGDFMAHFRTELAREWASFPGDYGQNGINGGMYRGQRASVGRDALTRQAQRWLDEREGRTKRPPVERADGTGFNAQRRAMQQEGAGGQAFADDYRRRAADQAKRQAEMFGGDAGRAATEKAMRSPLLGAPQLNAEQTLNIRVNKAGPDTTVSTSQSGNLFRDVPLRRGEAMKSADGI